MSNVLYRATKYMNAEDALLAREKRPKKRERQEDIRQDKGPKMVRTGERWEDRRTMGGQVPKTPHREIHEFHLTDCPD